MAAEPPINPSSSLPPAKLLRGQLRVDPTSSVERTRLYGKVTLESAGLAQFAGGCDHVGQCRTHFVPFASLQAAIRIDPEL